MKIFCALLLLSAALHSTYAASYSGADLKRFMDAGEALKEERAGADQVGAGVYIGYLAGVTESFQGIYYCLPSSIKLHEVTAVIAKYLRDNPQQLDQSAQVLALKALELAYPCPNP